ncbi:ABC transporter substrate-binding protein [Paenibacillus sp. KS-LC4]|uniref:ABC transporter substrate-binding protein n=1 Tax=Paenibacillus sp. KS-LC4 TaxID=2979727 RepID=UPI0030CCBF5F
MKSTKHLIMSTASLTLMIGMLLSACGANPSIIESPAASSASSVQPSTEADAAAQTRTYTDSKGHTVEIPVEAKRIIYTGSDIGDILALGIKPVGAALGIIKDQVAFPELLDGIEDVGDLLGDAEKITALDPDLILLDSGGTYYEEGAFDTLSKIAPTLTYDRLDTNERLRMLGDIVGKEQQAEEWIASYDAKAKEVAAKLNIQTGESASVFLLLGKDFYVMGDKSFAATLYHTLGYKPTEEIQKNLIDANEQFSNISSELLPDFAGDWLFVLTDEDDAERSAADSYAQSAIWKSIPAVKNGQVIYLPTKWNFSDPITMERLLDQLPAIMNK